MAFRFRRRLQIFPGISLNLGKTGISFSLGRKGAHVTLGPKGTRTTVGLPGTGMSWTKHQGHQPAREREKLKDIVITGGREMADNIARTMQYPEISTTERDELRACRDQCEQYVKAAESEATQLGDVDIVSLARDMADLGDQFININRRIGARLGLGQIAETP